MPETIVLTLGVTVAGGPKTNVNRTITVDAYDKINVTMPDASSGLEIELQPGGSGQVHFLLVTSNQYGDDLTYKVNSETDDHVSTSPTS